MDRSIGARVFCEAAFGFSATDQPQIANLLHKKPQVPA